METNSECRLLMDPAPRVGDERDGPASVSSTLNNRSVGNLTLNAVRSIDPDQLHPVAAANTGVAFQPRALLALLAYCYAIGILPSQDIEQAMEEDQFFRLLCADEFPSWHVIRRFRRLNRETLRQCLETIALAAGASSDSRRRILPVTTNSPLPTFEATGVGRPGPAASEQVDRLIELAIWLDTVALDT